MCRSTDTATPLIVPEALRAGDVIAIVSPAGIARPDNVEKACEVLRQRGYAPYISRHALGRHGSYSATVGERLEDMTEALMNPEVKAIMCTRGGYGAAQLLDSLDRLPLRQNAKWLTGFSDISALHALFSRHGIVSVHTSMTKRLAQTEGKDRQSEVLFDILEGNLNPVVFESHQLNRSGTAEGRLTGGNLSVLAALASTPFDIFREGDILFIEDINEPIYKINRILWQLRMRGVLESLGGLIVGQFTGYNPDANHTSMELMIKDMTDEYDYPVAFGAPIGHIDTNTPLAVNVPVRLTVDSTHTSIIY